MISDDFQIGPNGAYEHVGNELDIQYQDLLQHILDNGVEKKDRTGTGTLSVFGHQIRHNMKDGFPLLTTKKMAWKQIVTELLWFLRGDTNIKYLVDNDCHIWDGDAYKAYQREFKEKHYLKPTSTKEEFINKIKTDDEFAKQWGELGPIYGKQWRSWEGKGDYRLPEKVSDWVYTESGLPVTKYQPKQIDQIANLISELKTNPDSRRLMVNAWNVGELSTMILPPCHYGFQVYTRELSLEERKVIAKKVLPILNTFLGNQSEEGWIEQCEKLNIPTRAISLMFNMRSCDIFLGLPFNIASYGLLLEIIAKEVNMVPGELIGNLGDTHLYLNHIEQAKEQIGREPYELPTLEIEHSSLDPVELVYKLGNYQSHPTIKAPLSN
jgi:thymidylate synthase